VAGRGSQRRQPRAGNLTDVQCLFCLLDALAKLESGAIVVNLTATISVGTGQPVPVTIRTPFVIDVDVATLLQAQLGISLLGDENATIFEICNALETQTLNLTDVITGLNSTLTTIVKAQLTNNPALTELLSGIISLVPGIGNAAAVAAQVVVALNQITGTAGVQLVVNQILADVLDSLELFIDCNTSTIPTNGAAGTGTGAGIVGTLELPTIQQMIFLMSGYLAKVVLVRCTREYYEMGI
jgi:hypothetical protein